MTSLLTLPTSTRRLVGIKGIPQIIGLGLVLLIDWLVSPQFFTLRMQDGRLFGSLIDVLNRGAPVTLLSLGMVLVIATGGIDLSVGAVIAIAGATAATLINAGLPVVVVVALALAAGVACGLWNGLLVSLMRIQPIVATLTLMVAGRGVAQLITEGRIITFVDPHLAAIAGGSFLGLPMPVVIIIGMLAITLLLVRATALGLLIEAVGINRRSSAYAGVNTQMIIMLVYVWAGLCAAVAGVVLTADIKAADANNAGLWMELDAILAVVIGGTSLLGGRFSVVMAVLGALIIQAMNTGILLSGFKPELNLIVKSVVVLIILFVQSPALKGIYLHARSRRIVS
ncbi:ABC transporter permease [Telmatospirillum sp.]|uniref:ABC transporter permease n=1 Tax=Telmatospirillum sp. TaxID=2079197 RepID=UPI00284CABE1|nr:ABC transporter permease [Telmatospirillum sp.]MDR3436720.1 ABC transporter permease [Telmatospirillum sp.]